MTHLRRAPLLRTAGPIAAAVLLAMAALALHPHLSGRSTPRAEILELGTLALRDRLVHGTLLVLVTALLAWLTSYALRRGLSRAPIVAGLVGFALGSGALVAAGLIDGFVLPEFVARSASASPANLSVDIELLAAMSIAVNVLTAFAIVAMACAIGAWSFDLAHDGGEDRAAGILGFVSAAASVTVLVAGGANLRPVTLIAVLCAQGVWYIRLGAMSARQRTRD